MKMTREESIRNFREHWASLAISGTADKRGAKTEFEIGDWVKVASVGGCHSLYNTFFEENNLEEFVDKFKRGCSPTVGDSYRIVAIGKYYGESEAWYGPLYVIESRNGQVYIINNDKKGMELIASPETRFSIGDKVYPISKTVPGFENNIKEDVHWQKSEPRGYFFVTGIDEYKTKSTGKTVYVCNFRKNTTTGNYFFESDLRPYVEPEKTEYPKELQAEWVGFKVGDRVRVKKGLVPGKWYDDVRFAQEMSPYLNADTVITRASDPYGYRLNIDGGKWFWSKGMLEPMPSINHCPEDKTVTVQTITIEFKGPKTICTIENQFGTFKGRAKCHPTDQWNEKIGADLALGRAVEKFNEYEPDA